MNIGQPIRELEVEPLELPEPLRRPNPVPVAAPDPTPDPVEVG